LPAFSNPLSDLLNPPPKEAAAPAPAPAPAKEPCALQPGRSAAPGQHWVYHLEGHRKCWFQAAAATVLVKKQIHRHATKPVIAPEENESATPRKRMVADAWAQLLATEPSDALQPTPPAAEVVDTASEPAKRTATLVPAVPTVGESTVDQATPEPAMRRPVDVEVLLAAAVPVEGDPLASSARPATSGASSTADTDEDQSKSMATQAGVMLIALGFISLLVGLLRANRSRDSLMAPVRQA
jgi:hypothetical protein